MAIVKYVSSKGIEFNLLSFDCPKLEKADFHNVKWSPETIKKQYGTVINRFTMNAQEYDCTFKLKDDPASRKQKIEDFLFQTEYDIANKAPGYLYYNNQYIAAYFYEHDTRPVDSGMVWTEIKGSFYCPFPFWIEEQTYEVDPGHIEPLPQAEDVKGYPLDRNISYAYTYSYPYTGNTGVVTIDTPFGADYRVKVYGPIADYFEMVVNGQLYKVDYPLQSSQRLIIDSRDFLPISKKCYVQNENGTTIDVFNYRDPNSVLFERFIGNEATIHVDKPYKFDLTLFLERSEPK